MCSSDLPDANTLLSVADHCLRSRNYVNLIIAGKQAAPQWLDMDAAARHCAVGAGVWAWASNDGGAPDVVLACAGEVPTPGGAGCRDAAASLCARHSYPLRQRR